jgi:hypothetical protein
VETGGEEILKNKRQLKLLERRSNQRQRIVTGWQNISV